MRVYITKYALTAGIIEVQDAEYTSSEGMISVKSRGTHAYFHGEGKDWHHSKDGAIKRAEVMRRRKLESIEKQRQRIEQLRFE